MNKKLVMLLVIFSSWFALGFPACAAIAYRTAASASLSSVSVAGVQPRTAGSRDRASSGNVNPGLPSGTVANDILLCRVETRDNVAVTMTGWTLLMSATSGSTHQALVFWKKAVGGDSTTVTHSGGSGIIAQIVGFYNVDTTTPFEGTASLKNSGSDTTTETNSITTSTVGAVLVFTAHTAVDSSNISSITPSTWTSISGANTNSGSANASMDAWYLTTTVAGLQGPFTGTRDTPSAISSGGIIALKPSATASTPSLTINKPTGTVNGDVMIASIAVAKKSSTPTTVVITPPSGWTLIRRVDQTSSNRSTLNTFYKAAGGSEPASYDFQITAGTNDGAVGGILSFSGVDNVAPIDVSGGSATASSTNHTAPSVTTTVGSGQLVTVHEFSSSRTWAPPSTMTERVEVSSRTPSNKSGISMEINSSTSLLGVAGPTSTRTAVASGDNDRGATQSIALRPGAALDHIRIQHDGSASSCAAEAITIKACADSTCSSLYTGGVTGIGLTPTASTTWTPGSTVSIPALSGSVAVTINRTAAGAATLGTSGTISPTPANSSDCYNIATASNSCSLSFSSSFSFDVLDHAAGTPQVVNITSCNSTFAGQSRSVKFWNTYNNPSSGTVNGRIVAGGSGNADCSTGYTTLGTAAPASGLALTFDNVVPTAPKATFTFCYPDAGNVKLDARYDGSVGTGDAGTTILGNDFFVARPYTFKIAGYSPSNPAGASKFVSAGSAFTATVTAANKQLVATPNFGKETAAEGVTLTSVVSTPTGGDDGALGCKASTSACVIPGSAFTAGVATLTDLVWDEVGVMQIRPLLSDADYLGAGQIAPASPDDLSGLIGRFYPHHYALTPGSPIVTVHPLAVCAVQTDADVGDISNGTTILVVGDASAIAAGDGIVVSGAGSGGVDLRTTVASSDGIDTLVLTNAASTTVTAAPVFFRRGYSYMGEPIRLSFQIGAQNANNGTTTNYDGTTFTAGSANMAATGNDSWGLWAIGEAVDAAASNTCRAVYSAASPFNTTFSGSSCPTRPTSPFTATAARLVGTATYSTPDISWSAGVGTFTGDFLFSNASSADGPYNWLAVGVLPQDSDGATLQVSDKNLDTDSTAGADRARVGVIQLRYGRARLQNAYGSELLSLPVTLTTQYWNGTGWVLNTADQCTSMAVSALDMHLAASGTTSATISSIVSSGDAGLSLSAPGSGKNGYVDVTINAPIWLEYNWKGSVTDPTARATFGIFKSPILYIRENY